MSNLREQRIRTDNIIGIGSEAGERSGRIGLHIEHMPNVLIGAFERAEANRDAEDSLSSPILGRNKGEFSNLLRLARVHKQLARLIDVRAQNRLERIIVLIEPRAVYGYDEVEERLETGS